MPATYTRPHFLAYFSVPTSTCTGGRAVGGGQPDLTRVSPAGGDRSLCPRKTRVFQAKTVRTWLRRFLSLSGGPPVLNDSLVNSTNRPGQSRVSLPAGDTPVRSV